MKKDMLKYITNETEISSDDSDRKDLDEENSGEENSEKGKF